MEGLKCQNCGNNTWYVIDTRLSTRFGVGAIMRRRICKMCGKKITTYELPVNSLEALFNQEEEPAKSNRFGIQSGQLRIIRRIGPI